MFKILNKKLSSDEKLVVSFSGGRTSGYMLYKLIEHFGKEDIIVTFANTGKEREETLEFVRDCSVNWDIPIHWLELGDIYYKHEHSKRAVNELKVVDFETASRNGEPFRRLCIHRKMLPSFARRFCTESLKIEVIRKFLNREYYGNHFYIAVGIREDEKHRLGRPNSKRKTRKNMTNVYPLVELGIDLNQVTEFWDNQSFDLKIDSIYGNCDLCFLKAKPKLITILRNNPESVDWWLDLEKDLNQMRKDNLENPTYQYWGQSVNYETLLEISKNTTSGYDTDIDPGVSCFCTD